MLDRLVSWAGLSSEDWLNYVGIGLLLFGLAFLFQYSVEQGWLVPEVRVGFGAALGSALLVAGLRIYNARRRLRQVLLGGSSATFYAAELRVAAHALFVVVTGVLVGRIGAVDPEAARILRPAVLSELVGLGLIAGGSVFVRRRWLRWTYRGVVLAGWLGWWAGELAPVAHGQAYVSGVWGVTAAALLVGGAWADRRPVQIGGLATLGLFVGKLFLVDLASLPALWRIGLFLGFGAAFLAISYLLPGLVVGPLERAETGGGESAAPGSEISDA